MAKNQAVEEQLDANVVDLVQALSGFDGIYTISSCGGHENPGGCQEPAGSWYVSFKVKRTGQGWFALEFITWAINAEYHRTNEDVQLTVFAPPPFLNPRALCFTVEGHGSDARDVARFLAEVKQEYYPA